MPRRKQLCPQRHDKTDETPTNEPSEEPTQNGKAEEVLDLSVKRRRLEPEPTENPPSTSEEKPKPVEKPFALPKLQPAPSVQKGSLDQLSQLVSKVGRKSAPGVPLVGSSPLPPVSNSLPAMPSVIQGVSMQELWWKYMKKEESAELKRMNEAKQIFTCLQCQNSFQTMDQLVKHMGDTQHFANVPKHYSWSLQYARQKMRQMKLKLKYSERMMYFCHLCTTPFSAAVHQHFAEVHDMHNPVENMNFVQVIMGNGANKLHSPRRSESSVSPSTSAGGDSPIASPPLKSPKLEKSTESSTYGSSVLLKMEKLVENAVTPPNRPGHNSVDSKA